MVFDHFRIRSNLHQSCQKDRFTTNRKRNHEHRESAVNHSDQAANITANVVIRTTDDTINKAHDTSPSTPSNPITAIPIVGPAISAVPIVGGVATGLGQVLQPILQPVVQPIYDSFDAVEHQIQFSNATSPKLWQPVRDGVSRADMLGKSEIGRTVRRLYDAADSIEDVADLSKRPPSFWQPERVSQASGLLPKLADVPASISRVIPPMSAPNMMTTPTVLPQATNTQTLQNGSVSSTIVQKRVAALQDQARSAASTTKRQIKDAINRVTPADATTAPYSAAEIYSDPRSMPDSSTAAPYEADTQPQALVTDPGGTNPRDTAPPIPDRADRPTGRVRDNEEHDAAYRDSRGDYNHHSAHRRSDHSHGHSHHHKHRKFHHEKDIQSQCTCSEPSISETSSQTCDLHHHRFVKSYRKTLSDRHYRDHDYDKSDERFLLATQSIDRALINLNGLLDQAVLLVKNASALDDHRVSNTLIEASKHNLAEARLIAPRRPPKSLQLTNTAPQRQRSFEDLVGIVGRSPRLALRRVSFEVLPRNSNVRHSTKLQISDLIDTDASSVSQDLVASAHLTDAARFELRHRQAREYSPNRAKREKRWQVNGVEDILPAHRMSSPYRDSASIRATAES
ncbi:hypothetical protein MRB53_039748 [Persea americana]|nr:hypothetical protein MRB53_039748 [Persea americana]